MTNKNQMPQSERIGRVATDSAWEYSRELHILASMFLHAVEYARSEHVDPSPDMEKDGYVATVEEEMMCAFEEQGNVDESEIPMLIAVMEAAIAGLRRSVPQEVAA